MSHKQTLISSGPVAKGGGKQRAASPRRWLMVVAISWALVLLPVLGAQVSKPTDYDVKAVYLYNFGRFVEWPGNATASSGDSFTICILGQDPFGAALDATFAGETIGGKSIAARRIATPQESGNCQILFVSAAEETRLLKIIETLDKEAILTVSDMPQFSQKGGMIQFVLEGKKVRFEVNLTAVRHAGLTLSSELLKVATTVRRPPSSGD
jgi:hypothetical protein